MDFESKLKELQEITQKLENPSINIDEGVRLYEQGANIAKECFATIAQVKGKVTVIRQDLENFREENLD